MESAFLPLWIIDSAYRLAICHSYIESIDYEQSFKIHKFVSTKKTNEMSKLTKFITYTPLCYKVSKEEERKREESRSSRNTNFFFK